jgi:DNA-binding NtrC family response regulator/tetratricopeptide (TPR) repeat protein
MMNTPQHGHYGEWSRPIPAGDDYAAAQEYYRNENYSKAEEILRRHVEDDYSVQPAQEQISSESVLVLYCWCLYQLKRFDDLELKLDAICDERGELRGEILLVWCRLKLQNGGFDLAALACQRFISEHCDAIPPIMGRFMFVLGIAQYKLGNVEDAVESLEAAHALNNIVGNRHEAALAGNFLGFVAGRTSNYLESIKWYKRSLTYFVGLGLPRKCSMVHLNLGISHYKTGEYEASKYQLEQSLRLGAKANAPHRQCFANIALGNVHRLTRDFESARRHLHTAYNQAQELQFPREEALALEFLGDVYRDEGQTESARRFYARAMAIGLQIAPEGDIVMELRRRNGECFGLENRPAEAMPELQRALDMSRAQKDRFEEGVTLRVMSEVAYRSHDLANARRFIDKSCAVLVEIGARHEAAIALLQSVELRLAEVETGRGQSPRAMLLDQAWRQATEALDLFMRVDVRWWTDKCRATVARVSAMRSAAERGAADAKSKLAGYAPGDIIVHASTAMRDLVQLCDMFASCDDPVLVTGETGTGKEVVARRLHTHGRRADGPLVVVNVAAIPQTMFEREFFGHTKGAFSGADRDSQGYAAQADGGTLFLDEIGDLPLEVQPKLLRLLQEGTYQAIGDPKVRRTDVRLIAATNANLRQHVAEGKFRADLYYRLQTLELDIAPLRDRPEDVLPLLRHFLSLAANRPVDLAEYFNRRSLAQLVQHEWPGNAREIAMVAKRAHLALLAHGRVLVQVVKTDGSYLLADGPGDMPTIEEAAPAFLTPVEAAERTRILLAIEANGGSRLLAAQSLGMGRSTLYRKLARLGIATRQD